MDKSEPDNIFLKGDGSFPLQIVGESHYQDSLAAICGPRKEQGEELEIIASLILEDNNKYDSNAVRVDIAGKTVGYIKRKVAPVLRDQLKQNGASVQDKITCNAKIVGGWSSKGGRGFYGVRLDVPYEEVDASEAEETKKKKSFPWLILVIVVLLVFSCIFILNQAR